ncbi:MAG: ABC transporter substrate-binding protein [Candidatus Thiodiazotropha weberae]|nr:ABC transporter substrate-binding protein [Candidatus Thiodiazotropha weberae]
MNGERMPRGGLLTALLLSCLLITACQEQETELIRMGLANAPLNLDPRFATDATSERVNRLLYQRLVEFDPNSMPKPGIADWEAITPVHYRFTLNEHTGEFSNGEKLNARDVVTTYRQVLDPALASPKQASLQLVASMEVIDEQRVDFHLKRPDPLFPAYLTLDILPAELIEKAHNFAREPVGSGAFDLIEWPQAGELHLQRRSDGQGFQLITVNNPTVRALKLLRNEIDLLQNDLSPELIGYLRRQPGLRVEQQPGSNYTYIGFNLQDPLTGNLEIRQAIAHAIDRQAIIQSVMQGAARQAESLFPPEHWASEQLAAYEYNPEKARKRLAALGYNESNPLRLTYKTSSDPFRIRLATVIQSQLKAVGIDIDLRSYDWGTFFGDIKQGNFQLYSLSWVGIRTPDIYRDIFASDALPPSGANRGRYANNRVDQLLNLAEQTDNLSAQAELYHQVAAELHRDLPYIPLWYEDQLSAQGSRIKGYQLMSDGNYDGLAQIKLKRALDGDHVQSATEN